MARHCVLLSALAVQVATHYDITAWYNALKSSLEVECENRGAGDGI